MELFLVIYRVVWNVESNEYGFGGAITNHRNSETNRNRNQKKKQESFDQIWIFLASVDLLKESKLLSRAFLIGSRASIALGYAYSQKNL
ncbi:MAG: hypothetical protein ACPGIA_05320 [Luteolibacter sp.]